MTWASDALDQISEAFEGARDPDKAVPMGHYMRDQFPFLGIPATEQKTLTKQALGGMKRPNSKAVTELVTRLWEKPEREYQYAGCGLVSRYAHEYNASFIETVEHLIVTKSWWDTVDSLAKGGAGELVRSHPGLVTAMDGWVRSDNLWLRRTAILHQLGYRQRTDAARLFRYCELNSSDTDFFIRKAIGWALREYSKVDPRGVREFVEAYDDELSNISKREAMLWINGGRGAKVRQQVPAATVRQQTHDSRPPERRDRWSARRGF